MPIACWGRRDNAIDIRKNPMVLSGGRVEEAILGYLSVADEPDTSL